MSDERPLYGAHRLAGHLGISRQALYGRLRHPIFSFVGVGSAAVDGGAARWSCPSSLDNADALYKAYVAEQRRSAAHARWDVSGGTSAVNVTRARVA